MTLDPDYELAIIGANRAGISVAIDAFAAGVEKLVIIDSEDDLTLPDLGSSPEIRLGTSIESIHEDGIVTLRGDGFEISASAAVVAARTGVESVGPDYPIPDTLTDRIHFSLPDSLSTEDDVLVIGTGETAAESTEDLVAAGHSSVALSLPSVAFDQLAHSTREELLRLESARQATIFWHSHPTSVSDADGFPMVSFSDRRTPDLIFDHIVYNTGTGDPAKHLERLGITVAAVSKPAALYVLTEEDPDPDEPEAAEMVFVSPGHAWSVIRDRHFQNLAGLPDLEARPPLVIAGLADRLREKHYNATITSFENYHSDLWILRVKPDVGDASHQPGQYATLALGYWEPRLDGSDEHLDEDKTEKLVRRSYSISHPMLDENDNLVAPEDIDGVEFYIVLVRPEEGMDHLPELTPRMALKKAGDRIFMGGKVAGRYTLKTVTDPTSDVVLLSTGTGEAPHNNMVAKLLREGHTGRIVSACTVRYQRDLAYLETHRRLEELYPNYSYFALTTREADTINNKVYIQDMITNGMLSEVLGHEPNPEQTQFFLCGNPLMIGFPEWDGDTPTFPEPRGVCEILTELGFTVDHKGVVGNVHYEEYW